MTELVKRRLTFWLIDSDHEWMDRCDFVYSSRDPFAVHFRLPGKTWVFCRDLLAEGLTLPAGDGDVYIEPVSAKDVDITLSSPSGEATLRFDLNDLLDALDATWQVVECGHEHIDIDAELASIMEGQS